MAQPVYLPKSNTTVDGYVDPNVSTKQQVVAKRNAFGGLVFEHIILPYNSGGSVGIGQGASENVKTYNANDVIVPNMALVYNSIGGVVTPDFTDAIPSPDTPTNFIGVAKTSTSVNTHNWIQLPVSVTAPQARYFHLQTYLPTTSQHMIFGGYAPNNVFGDTMLWDGTNWTAFPGGEPTNGRYGMAYTVDTIHKTINSFHDIVIFFGGADSTTTIKNETWIFDGIFWYHSTELAGTPHSRIHSAMAFQAWDGYTVMFGGYGDGYLNDTWLYKPATPFASSGGSWTQASSTANPVGRFGHNMCYDPLRRRTVLFGGSDGYNTFNDTWEWNTLAGWLLISTVNSPPPRVFASTVYDPVNKVTVLFGGYLDPALNSSGQYNIYSDVWYYDGVNWTQQLFFGPSPRSGAGVSFDIAQNAILLFGGGNGGPTRNLLFDNQATAVYQDPWELLTLTNQVDVQTSGETYVYFDATGLLSIAPGGFVRASDHTTVTVTTKLAHGFNAGDKFFISTPDDPQFSSGVYTIASIVDSFHFTYSSFGTVTSSINPLVISAVTPSNQLASSEVPYIQRYLSAGGVPGTVTPNGLGSSNDGFDPIFGIVTEPPVNNPDGSLFQTLIGTDRVGLVKMKIGAFHGFIAGLNPQLIYTAPQKGPIGTQIDVVGAGFNTTTLVQFLDNSFNSLSASYDVTSADHVSVTVPAGAQSLGFGITTSTGTVSGNFTVTPQITSISAPAHSIGTQITLIGTTFSLAAGSIGTSLPAAGAAPNNLSFAGSSGRVFTSFTVVDDSTIHVNIPSGAVSGDVTLGTTDGYTSLHFDVLQAPTITLIAPVIGKSGDNIAVTGTGFVASGSSGDGYGTLTFTAGMQTLSATRIIYNDTTMTVTVPTMPNGQGSTAFHLVFTNDAGTVTSSGTFTIVPPPQFLTAASSTLNGGINSSVASITLTSASGWPTGGSKFFIGTEQISYTAISTNTLTGCVRGINGTTAASHSNGAAASILTFISQTNDAYGVAGDTIRIFGEHGFTGLVGVGFGTYNSPTTVFVNDGYVTATVPSVVSPSNVVAAITVTAGAGAQDTSSSNSPATNPHNFTILQGHTITSISNPGNFLGTTTGKTGDLININGTNFLGVTSVIFSGNTNSASFTVVNANVIQVVVPDPTNMSYTGLVTGVITVNKSTFFTATSPVFTYYSAPSGLSVSSPSPDGGSDINVNGGYGTIVTLGGTNLNQGTPTYPKIQFGGVNAAVGSSSPTVITTTVPTGANSGITVFTAGGQITVSFTVLKPVFITSFYTDWPYDHTYATPLYPTQIDVYGGNFRNSHNSQIIVSDTSGHIAYIPTFTYYNSTHIRFDASVLGPFIGETCYINIYTYYPGGSYSTYIYGLNVFYPIT